VARAQLVKHNLPLPPPNHPSLLTKAIQLYVVKNKVNINKHIPKGMDEVDLEALIEANEELHYWIKVVQS
jgi:hypothetical protein